jgi:hypothetical protein
MALEGPLWAQECVCIHMCVCEGMVVLGVGEEAGKVIRRGSGVVLFLTNHGGLVGK